MDILRICATNTHPHYVHSTCFYFAVTSQSHANFHIPHCMMWWGYRNFCIVYRNRGLICGHEARPRPRGVPPAPLVHLEARAPNSRVAGWSATLSCQSEHCPLVIAQFTVISWASESRGKGCQRSDLFHWPPTLKRSAFYHYATLAFVQYVTVGSLGCTIDDQRNQFWNSR